MELKRVVVTGMGALTPIGNTVQEYWQGLSNGVSGAVPITLFDTTNFKTKFACELKNFSADNHMDKKEARKLDRFTQLAIVASHEAVTDAGLVDNKNIDTDRVGVIFASGIGGFETMMTELEEFYKGGKIPRFNPFFIPKLIIDIAAGHISMRYGFRGPNFGVVSACASATNAIIESYNYIRLGMSDIVVTGGTEAPITEAGVGGFNAMRALSTRNDSPQTASRPFDANRDGFVMGEGAGTLVLEELEHAKRRGAKIYAELVGVGATADAHHLTAPHPEGLGAKNVMQMALRIAGMQPNEVDYINVHGTSTPLGDIAETLAIKSVFGDHAYNVSISSTKSMTGHLLGAAGAVEAIASILAVQNGMVPPTINFETEDKDIDYRMDFTLNKAKKREIRAALSNTFGFGGHNASVIFKRFEK